MSFVARKRVFLATRYRGPGFQVDGVGRVRTLPELGILLNADPTLNVAMLGDYDAEADGVFAASPLGTTAATTYKGDFDGRGHRLGGFRLVDDDPTPGIEDGLFGNVGDNSGVGWVHDLTLSVDIRQLHWERTTRDSAGRYLLGTTVGGAVASLRGTLERVTINGRVYGSGSGGQFGGLVGRNEQWPAKAIASVTKGNPTIIQTTVPHGIPTGQWACVANAGGMPALNSRQGNVSRLYTVTSLGASTLSIDIDSSGFPDYTSGGVIMGAGTVRQCRTNARVEVSPYNYNSYFSILVASNRGLLEYCQDSRRAESVIPRTTVPNPPTAAYTAGWTGKASISGDVLTVTETSLGAMAVGLDIFAPNTVPGTVVASGTQVTADLGGGSWRVSIAQAVTSRDLLAASGAPGTYLATGQWAANMAGDNGLPAVGDSPTAIVRYNKSYADLRNADNVNSANLTGAIVAYQGDGIAYGNEAYGKIEGASSVSGGIGFNALSSSAHYANLSACEVIALGGNAGGNAGQDYGASNDNIAWGKVTGLDAVGVSIGLMRGTAVATRLCAFGNAVGRVGVGSLIGQALTGASLDESLCFGVATGTSKVGAIGNRGTGVTISDVYFDIDSTGSAIGVGSGESTGVTGLSDAALVAGLPSGFDSLKWSRGVITPNYPIPTAAPVPPNPTVNLNPPPSLAIVGHATSIDSTTIDLSSVSIQAGDYCVLWNFAQNTTTTAPSLVAPSGFTLSIQQFSSNTHGSRISQYVKQLAGTETTISGIATGTRGRGMIALIVRGSGADLASTWTRLNARVAIDGAAGGNAVQSMGAGTSPCIVVGCAIYDSGTPPANQISLGDDEVIEIASAITPSLVMRVSYKIKNTGAAASTFTGDTNAGGVAVTCVNVSYAP